MEHENRHLYYIEIIFVSIQVNIFFMKIMVRNNYSSSSSSSYRATSTDIPDTLSPLLPIIHRFWQVFRATSLILA